MADEIAQSNDLGLTLAVPQPEVLLTPNIGVIGVGGAGGNAVNNMVQSGLSGVSFFAANTDAQALSKSLVADKIQLGVAITKGLGAGANPEVGKASAEESAEKIREILSGLHLLFLTAGMGGGTGTGAAPVIAKIAKEMGIMTVGVVSKPFNFEGKRRMKIAETGIIELQKYIDTLIVIPNQNLFRIDDGTMTFANGFKIADNVLCQGIRSITDLIMNTGLINHDFADVQAVLSTKGRCVLGSGEASGENRAKVAAEKAITNPLLDNSSIAGAHSLLLNISGGLDLTAVEVDTAAELIRTQVDPDANIIFGSNLDENLSGKIRVSLVATGIDDMINGTVEPSIEKPDIPLPEPIEVLPEPIVTGLSEQQPINPQSEDPILINIPPVQKEPPSLIVSDTKPETPPDDLVIQLTDSPPVVEPNLIDDPVPLMPEPTAIIDIPDIQPEINIGTKPIDENVKPAGTESFWGKFFGHPVKKKQPKPLPKKDTSVEPSFLDDLEAGSDLPSFFKQQR